MTIVNDPLGLSARRIALNARATALGTAISAWTGDANGRADLVNQQAQVSDLLNLGLSSNNRSAFGILNPTSSGPYIGLIGTAYNQFGIGIST